MNRGVKRLRLARLVFPMHSRRWRSRKALADWVKREVADGRSLKRFEQWEEQKQREKQKLKSKATGV